MCIFYMLLKVISYDDLSVLSMSAVGFQKESFDRGMGGWGELYRIFGDFLGFCKSPLLYNGYDSAYTQAFTQPP